MLRGLVIAAACALLLAIVPAGASAATPRLSSLQAQDLARTAKGVSAIAVKNPLAQWSCVYASDSAFWNCALNAASDGQPLAVVKLYDPQRRVWSVTIPRQAAAVQRLNAMGLGCRYGHFYSRRLVEPADAVTRLPAGRQPVGPLPRRAIGELLERDALAFGGVGLEPG